MSKHSYDKTVKASNNIGMFNRNKRKRQIPEKEVIDCVYYSIYDVSREQHFETTKRNIQDKINRTYFKLQARKRQLTSMRISVVVQLMDASRYARLEPFITKSLMKTQKKYSNLWNRKRRIEREWKKLKTEKGFEKAFELNN